jgi:hypothetical protein
LFSDDDVFVKRWSVGIKYYETGIALEASYDFPIHHSALSNSLVGRPFSEFALSLGNRGSSLSISAGEEPGKTAHHFPGS